jgi:hypothetical protein
VARDHLDNRLERDKTCRWEEIVCVYWCGHLKKRNKLKAVEYKIGKILKEILKKSRGMSKAFVFWLRIETSDGLL